jgi:hypothetical protein
MSSVKHPPAPPHGAAPMPVRVACTCGVGNATGVDHDADCAGELANAPSGTRPRVVNWNALQDRCEAVDRARVVRSILERCEHELAALEAIPHLGPDDVNELGAGKGFVGRAILALGRMGL